MNKVFRWFARVLLGIIALATALVVATLVYGVISQKRVTAATRIEDANGIESLETVKIGGIEQMIYLRGQDRDNPVLLFLHGGPGVPEMPTAREFGLRLEEYFVMVHWDQRGAGNSCTSEVPDESLHLEQYLADTLELVNLLRQRFHTDKIYLVGHSWGSVLGALTVQRHPDLFHAYVGMGQVVNMRRGEQISYRFVLDQAKAEENEEALEELATIHPPYSRTEDLMTQRAWLAHYHGDFYEGGGFAKIVRSVFFSPEYSLGKKLTLYACATNSLDQAWGDLQDVDLIRDIPRLDVPVYFFTGRHDYNTPFELVERYFEKLEAPHKEIVWFENSAHMPNIEEPDLFQDAIIRNVLPNTQPSDRMVLE